MVGIPTQERGNEKLFYGTLKMKKLILLLPLFLTACSANVAPVELSAQPEQRGFAAFATLSNSDDVIGAVSSVVYTKLAQYRYNAASLLRSKRITKIAAIRALERSDSIRSFLDNAVKNRDLQRIEQVRQSIMALESTLKENYL